MRACLPRQSEPGRRRKSIRLTNVTVRGSARTYHSACVRGCWASTLVCRSQGLCSRGAGRC
eukprot:10496372-Alexandrium_andersonii.AAC.1